MPRPIEFSRSRVWLRAAIFAAIAITAAGCADSGRFDTNPYASNDRPGPSRDVTGSINSRPAYGSVVSQPLPAPAQPAVAAGSYTGQRYSSAAQQPVAYRSVVKADVTSSVPSNSSGHWTWDGGSAITVVRGDTVESIARKHGVPAFAILQTNGLRSAADLRPGQRLVIPRYVGEPIQRTNVARVPEREAPMARPRVATAGDIHIVKPGESLIGIARNHGLSLAALARANRMNPFTKVSVGDRIKIPAEAGRMAMRQTPVTEAAPAPKPAQPHVAQPHTPPPVQRMASLPTQNVRVAMQEPATTESLGKKAEPAGGLPSFRWPVRGRIIAGFGAKPNGTQNDGINLAVPEGTPVKAAEDGVVAYAGNELKGYGNLILVRHANGYVSAYANASALLVKRGDTVKRGQVIAHAGQTGNVTSPQLHFEIRKGSTPVDPTKYLGGV